jgi:MinD-like ATPase involved in chromosome partitioning or flagellar assembly
MNTILTFYSYKGGVGRSMCLVNVGVTLAVWGYRVLLVDFDLEAPGLEYFFRPRIGNFDDVLMRQGVINLLSSAGSGEPKDWRQMLIEVSLPPLGSGDGPVGTIDILKSGNKGSDEYLGHLTAFRADDFYRKNDGGRIIEGLRDEWKDEYDFVLVDSRTGLTDIGGICTIQLPDILVILFTATEQGWAGATDVASKAIKHHSELPFERDRLKVLPIPTRIDSSEKVLTDEWLSRFARKLPSVVSNWIDSDLIGTDSSLRTFVDRTFVPYVPFYSFGEGIAVLDNVSSPSGIGYAFVGIAALLAQELRQSNLFVTKRDDYVALAIEAGQKSRLHRQDMSHDAVEQLYEASVFFIGKGGAGKTSLIRRLFFPNRTLPLESETTGGIETANYEFINKQGQSVRLNAWDFGGQTIYHAVHQFFMRAGAIYVLVDDTRSDDRTVNDEGFRHWLELVEIYAPSSPVLIFQNERTDRKKLIDLAGIKGRYENVRGVYSGNLEHSDAADGLREAIEECVYQLVHTGVSLPAGWVQIRRDIEKRAREVPYISQQEYFDIYRRHLEFDRVRAINLSRYLHDLGVCLHFQDDPLLAKALILQNGWVTEAVFRLLDDKVIRERFGRFTAADCDRLWGDSVYAEMHPELLALMQRFELCYQLPDRSPATWLAPQLFPPAKPTGLTLRAKMDGPGVVLRYRYYFLPKGIVSRLTVRLHRFLKQPEMAWMTGALFELGDTSVLMELLPKGNEIALRAQGPEGRSLLSVVSADLDALNETLSGLHDRVEKLVPCICTQCRRDESPEFFTHKQLIKRRERGRMRVECPRSYEELDVAALLDSVGMEAGAARTPVEVTTPLRVIRLFLASSSELRDDRDELDFYWRKLNDRLSRSGVVLEIVRWEEFLDSMSGARLHREYNDAIKTCDVFVSLFFTKIGSYADEEFEVAFQQFKAMGRPLIYTFFKNADIQPGAVRREDLESLWAFKKRLMELGHLHVTYDNIDQLKQKFSDQFDHLLEAGL